MVIEVPVDGFDPDKGSSVPVNKAHARVKRIDEDGGNKGEMIVDIEIVASDATDAIGMTDRLYFHKTPKAFGRIHTLAIALGMITADQIKDLQKAGRQPQYDFAGQGAEKHIHLNYETHEYNGNVSGKVGFGIYHIADKRCATWPKNAAYLKQAGIVIPPPSAAAPAPAPANQMAPPKPTANANDVLAGVL